MERIVIIGGGFAGLRLCKKLDPAKYEICLVDRNNFNSFPPLFYQIASSGLTSANICFPFRREFKRHRNVSYHMGHVKNIDVAAKEVTTSYETIKYDKLILAAGSTNNYFGMDSLGEETFGIKTVAEAAHTRDEILDRFERGALCQDKARRRELLTFLVVGGGPAGVEIAGALGEMKRYILRREYPTINPDEVTVTLVEGTDRLLGAMSEYASRKALEYLGSLMVNVKLQTRLSDYTDGVLTFANGEKMRSEFVMWTAGIKSNAFEWEGPQPELGLGRRLVVDEFNRVQGVEDVYAVGDISYMASPAWPKGHPQVAQVAIQQARNLARNMRKGAFVKPFKYNDKGTMATVGRNRAVADLNCMHLYGRPAWFVWMAVHLMSLLGMRNRITVFITWVWAYFTYSSSLRLILRPTRYPLRK